MRIGGIAAVAVAVGLTAGGAQAQTSMVNGVPVSEFEAGLSFWYSTKSFKTHLHDMPGLSGQTSDLSWTGISSGNAELNVRLNNLSHGFFFRGWGGGGLNFDGKMNDLDVGQINQDTTAAMDRTTGYYFGADVGWAPDSAWIVKFAPFAGLFYMHDELKTRNGATCNSATTYAGGVGNGSPCSGPGVAPVTTNGIDQVKNAITFWAPRVGIGATYQFNSRFTLSGDVAYLFMGQYENEDTHYHYGSSPTYKDVGKSGHGLQFQAMVDYKLAESKWSVGAGYRYWKIESGEADATKLPSDPGGKSSNVFESSGVIARANYQF